MTDHFFRILFLFSFLPLIPGQAETGRFYENPLRRDLLEFVVNPSTGLRATLPKVCAYYPDTGFCRPQQSTGNIIQYFYNTTLATCQPFWYSRCGGNQNRFASKPECDAHCLIRFLDLPQADTGLQNPTRRPTPPPPQPTTPSSLINALGLGGTALCSQPKNPGQDCGNGGRKVQRWYWNDKKWNCMAFLFNGCGGNKNNFASKRDCQERCQPMDGPSCVAGAAPLPDVHGNCRTLQCPDTHICRMGAFFGSCCPKDIENEILCPGGEEAYQLEWQGFLVSDFCNELQCPAGYKCAQGKVYAKCCKGTAGTGELKTSPERRSSVSEECMMIPEPGPCRRRETRFFFNIQTFKCEQFFYSGCGGNRNNFKNLSECQERCFKRTPFS